MILLNKFQLKENVLPMIHDRIKLRIYFLALFHFPNRRGRNQSRQITNAFARAAGTAAEGAGISGGFFVLADGYRTINL